MIQACHGKLAPMKRLQSGDKVSDSIASKQFWGSNVSISIVTEDESYQYEMFPGFCPFRRNVIYDSCVREVNIYDLMSQLSFTQSKSWGMYLRYGFFEISIDDYQIIESAMKYVC